MNEAHDLSTGKDDIKIVSYGYLSLTLKIPAYLPPYSYRLWTNLSTNCIGTMSALTKKNYNNKFFLYVIQSKEAIVF